MFFILIFWLSYQIALKHKIKSYNTWPYWCTVQRLYNNLVWSSVVAFDLIFCGTLRWKSKVDLFPVSDSIYQLGFEDGTSMFNIIFQERNRRERKEEWGWQECTFFQSAIQLVFDDCTSTAYKKERRREGERGGERERDRQRSCHLKTSEVDKSWHLVSDRSWIQMREYNNYYITNNSTEHSKSSETLSAKTNSRLSRGDGWLEVLFYTSRSRKIENTRST